MLREGRRFQLGMAFWCVVTLCISVLGCRLTETSAEITPRAIAVLLFTCGTLWLPLYWHEKQRLQFRDATLTIPWVAPIVVLLPFPLLVAARLRLPLQDSLFARMDESMGIRVPDIVRCASSHWIGLIVNRSYDTLVLLLVAALFAPALAGKRREANEFITANLICYAFALPLFAALPAIGPWFHYHFPATPAQALCQTQLLSFRTQGAYEFGSSGVGVVCFPSFHVIWAILCARALSGFRFIRIPVLLLSGMITVSTLTTGWHYFSDVVAGAILATLSIYLAGLFLGENADTTAAENRAQQIPVAVMSSSGG